MLWVTFDWRRALGRPAAAIPHPAYFIYTVDDEVDQAKHYTMLSIDACPSIISNLTVFKHFFRIHEGKPFKKINCYFWIKVLVPHARFLSYPNSFSPTSTGNSPSGGTRILSFPFFGFGNAAMPTCYSGSLLISSRA